jgi:hypothetical protein
MIDAGQGSRADALAREIEEEMSTGVLNSGDRAGTKDDLRKRFNVAVANLGMAAASVEAHVSQLENPDTELLRLRLASWPDQLPPPPPPGPADPASIMIVVGCMRRTHRRHHDHGIGRPGGD